MRSRNAQHGYFHERIGLDASAVMPKYRNFSFLGAFHLGSTIRSGRTTASRSAKSSGKIAKSWVSHQTYECPEPTPGPYCAKPLRSPRARQCRFCRRGLALRTAENSDFCQLQLVAVQLISIFRRDRFSSFPCSLRYSLGLAVVLFVEVDRKQRIVRLAFAWITRGFDIDRFFKIGDGGIVFLVS